MKERRAERTKAVKENRAAAVAAKKSSQPPRLAKTLQPKPPIAAGSTKYLDFKNGFRDVVFGQQESSISGLVLKIQDEQKQIKTFTRSGEELTLDGVPLESIEYSFFNGRLYQILITWRIEQKDPSRDRPAAETLAPACASLYGPPTRRVIKKDVTELKWRGQRVELKLGEEVAQGVADSIKGGWAIPPVASGRIVLEEIGLRKAIAAVLASATEARKGGL